MPYVLFFNKQGWIAVYRAYQIFSAQNDRRVSEMPSLSCEQMVQCTMRDGGIIEIAQTTHPIHSIHI